MSAHHAGGSPIDRHLQPKPVSGRALRGEPYIPSQGDSYTATIEIWPGALQPLGTLLLFTAFLGHLVAMPMVALAVHRLADPEVWAARATWTWLLVGTLSVLGTIVLAFSGPGEMVRNWVMD